MNEEITTLRTDYEKSKFIVPGLAERFQFYQDLRGYVTDLVECLDEKVGHADSIRERYSRHNYFFYLVKHSYSIH